MSGSHPPTFRQDCPRGVGSDGSGKWWSALQPGLPGGQVYRHLASRPLVAVVGCGEELEPHEPCVIRGQRKGPAAVRSGTALAGSQGAHLRTVILILSRDVGTVSDTEKQRGDATALHPGRDTRCEFVLQDQAPAMQADPPHDDPVTANQLPDIQIKAQVQAARNIGTPRRQARHAAHDPTARNEETCLSAVRSAYSARQAGRIPTAHRPGSRSHHPRGTQVSWPPPAPVS